MTIVELLVAVTISLLIVIVIAQLFLGSRQTFSTTDDVSRMQENIRFTQQLLIRTIHLAGYKSQPNSITNTVFNTTPALSIHAGEGEVANTETFTVRYQGARGDTTADGSVVDCLGVRIDAGVMAYSTFSIRPGQNGRNALFCSNQADRSNPREIVANVNNMQLRFGEDTDGDLAVNHYVAFSGVANMSNVLSMRVALLFETPTAVSKTTVSDDATRKYDLNGVLVGPFPTDTGRIRRPVTVTINLRNRTP